MLMKLIFLLHLTFSLQGDKTRKTRLILDSAGHPQMKKKIRRLKNDGLNNLFKNRSCRSRLFGFLPRVINFYGLATFDTLALLKTLLFVLKKLFLLSMLVICRIFGSLLNDDINGN
jgi:hypothetical protein